MTEWICAKYQVRGRGMFIQETSKFRSKHVSNISDTSKTGAEQDVDELLRRLTSDQNLLFLFLENERANISCKRNLCLHFRRRIAYLYLLLALLLMLNNTPDEGHLASSHTLCQKLVASLSLPAPSFQPTSF